MDADRKTNPAAAAPVLALTADLMFAARVRSTAAAVGTEIVLARTAQELKQKALDRQPREIIIDLDSRTVDVVKLIGDLKQDATLAPIPILAYVSHVREDLIAAAKAAGAERVMARGAFARELHTLLAE